MKTNEIKNYEIKKYKLNKNTNNHKIILRTYNLYLTDIKKKFNVKKNLLYLKYPYVYYRKKYNFNYKDKNKIKFNFFNSNLKKKLYIFQLYSSIIIFLILLFLFCYSKYYKITKEVFSVNLKEALELSSLYDNRILNKSSESLFKKSPFTIGIISIPKIDITYPIISECTPELLKISPCRFYGVFPNEIGNCVIAGHNYVNNKHFSNLKNLDLNDLIFIHDYSGNCVTYTISSIYETEKDNISSLNNFTNNKRKITLITCNNINDKRLILEAYEIN